MRLPSSKTPLAPPLLSRKGSPSSVLRASSLTGRLAHRRILTVANGWEYFASAVIALFVVDRLGRRKLMIIGAAVMAISTVFLAAFLSQDDNQGLAVCFWST